MRYRPDRIFLSPPHMGGHELNYVHKAFEDNYVAPAGPNIEGFERDICEATGVKFAAAVSSGTAAIHLALLVLGIQAGDEVLVSDFTFIASVNPVLYMGATPVFIDSEADSWNISPEFLELAIQDRIKKGKKPKALILVHLYGMPAKLAEIMQICRQYEIPVIEDAAEALGATYQKKALGSFGDIGILSFNGNKIITTSGGGALLSDNEAYINRAKFLATQAKDPAPYYEHSEVGYNYRLSNISAGIGRGQMGVLAKRVKQRREVFGHYRDAFKGLEAIEFQEEPVGHFSNRWLTTILLKHDTVSPEDLRLHLEESNIESRPLWKPMHLQPVFQNQPFYGDSTSQRLFEQGLCLPSGSSLEEKDQERVCKLVKQLLG